MPPITVFCPFTRLDRVQPWFRDLRLTDLKPEKTNLAFIIDIGEDDNGVHVGSKIYEQIKAEIEKDNWRSFLIIRNYDHHVSQVNITTRRKRIAEIHNQSKDLIRNLDGEFVLGLEDDTVFTGLSVEILFGLFTLRDNIGFVTTYEAGRWHNKIIGIWGFDDVNDPKECWTELPGKGIEECDAAGMYCYLTPTKLYLEHEYYSENWQPWGPDVNYGLWLRQNGYKNYVDWTQPTGHHDGEMIIEPQGDLFVERFTCEEMPTWVRRSAEP